jgi:hypothetical protein
VDEDTADSTRSKPAGNKSGASEISIEVAKGSALILVRVSGAPHQEAIVKMLEDLNTIATREGSTGVLIDETALDPSVVGPGAMDRFVGAWRQAPALRTVRLAVVVSNPAMFGLNRQFEALTQGHGEIGVFSDAAEAAAWLGEAPKPGGKAHEFPAE